MKSPYEIFSVRSRSCKILLDLRGNLHVQCNEFFIVSASNMMRHVLPRCKDNSYDSINFAFTEHAPKSSYALTSSSLTCKSIKLGIAILPGKPLIPIHVLPSNEFERPAAVPFRHRQNHIATTRIVPMSSSHIHTPPLTHVPPLFTWRCALWRPSHPPCAPDQDRPLPGGAPAAGQQHPQPPLPAHPSLPLG